MAYLSEPAPTPDTTRLYDADRGGYGFVMNLTRVWAHHPDAFDALLTAVSTAGQQFPVRLRGIMITAAASTVQDSYCSLAWGWKLSADSGAELATGVLRGDDEKLSPSERAVARWARVVARDPGSTTQDDVDALREAGFDDAAVLAMTAFIALRVAFSTVNGALGAGPDHELLALAPTTVVDTVTWGRPVRTPGESEDGAR